MKDNNGLHIFNLGTGKPCTVLKLIQTFARCHNTDIPYILHDRRTGYIQTSFCSNNKANDELNWSAQLTIEDMCNSYKSFINTIEYTR